MTTENRLLAVIPIEAGNKVEPDHMQKGLRASEIRSRRLFEAARDGILILDAVTLKITDVNPFKMELSGYSRDEFIGRELWAIGLFSDKEASQAAFRELQESGYIRYEDLPLETRHGALRGKRLTCRSLTSGCR
jgi:PAS domain S-box-containing protein